MNYHLMVDDKFINDFIRDAEKVAPGKNVYLIDNWKKNAKFVKSDLVTFAPFYTPAFKAILKKITNKDKVFVHWASDLAVQAVLSLPSDVPTGMFFWGGDVVEVPASRFKKTIYGPLSLPYFEKTEGRPKLKFNPMRPKRVLTSFAQRFFNYQGPERTILRTRDLFFKRLNFFLHWSHIDYQWLQNHYTTPAQHKYFFYDCGQKPDAAEQAVINAAAKSNGVTTILLGNSDTITNNHLEALQALSAYKDQPIKLVIPLNYGNTQYADFVQSEAIRIFGADKVMALRSFLARDEYYKMLAQVDVAVMFHYRSQAAGNVLALLYRGKKIFLHSNSTLYELLKTNDIAVFDSKEIGTMDFEEFKTPLNAATIQKNVEIVDRLFDEKMKMEALKEILN
ncbi:MAG: TDP-N-acetylfucosamine:lipid II N-acetylfucosaminyltransferase [Chitinophaga sp.]|uniref:TDP-N-acetylfucosamine:lipid II N-acetylfucosaminyltransferase n=1 Tax=Chitinophaga sp. TaxID=1869181 RepID=UPI001AFD6A7D|nr:TDP-N-acetylfucosamine:lipid II N-acetylfucosaminyltransferase [Chitinophaga sp.]MBO9732363.1 TDP-N-acetylfucosamine:lipid II N-acetylfucosaminyltransferase [Chitinophaga sp.]